METDWVEPFLRERDLLRDPASAEVAALAGGVSASIFEARTSTDAYVVKRPLAQLRVADTWLADPGRVVTEARALRLAAEIAPEMVPAVIDLDEKSGTLTMERAPRGWCDWRSELIRGEADERVAERLGTALASWHRETAGAALGLDPVASRRTFEQLRLEPFHEVVAGSHPDLAQPIGAAVERLRGEAACLVHGDFSPKNVLHGPEGVWVLDWEVAHVGAPIFDLAFLLAHLQLKAIHRPGDAPRYRLLATVFLAAYAGGGGLVDPADPGLPGQVGCLVLARVDGKSPAAYLTEAERNDARQLGTDLLRGEVRDGWKVLG